MHIEDSTKEFSSSVDAFRHPVPLQRMNRGDVVGWLEGESAPSKQVTPRASLNCLVYDLFIDLRNFMSQVRGGRVSR